MATSSPVFSWRRRWSAKKSILAALLGGLVVIAVVAGISISLAPAHISFAIAGAAVTHSIDKNVSRGYYNFTLVANNTSGRMSASYQDLTAQIWFGTTSTWIPIFVNTTVELPGWQPPGNATKVAVGTKLGRYSQAASNATKEGSGGSPPGCPTDDDLTSTLIGQDDDEQAAASSYVAANSKATASWPNSTVVVEARVRFRFGRTVTMTYTIRSSCKPVFFRPNGGDTTSLVRCIP